MEISHEQESRIEQYPTETPENPLVSICVVTYQHANYIKQCLDSILKQKVAFNFEIILGEDQSTDGTREICIEYAKKYPNIIRLFLHDRGNVIRINGQETGRFNFLYGLNKARGTYIAICDGDDYWTDETKLQQQVEILEQHNDISLCFHDAIIKYSKDINADANKRICPSNLKTVTSFSDIIYTNYIPTSSILFRKTSLQHAPVQYNTTLAFADWPLFISLASEGSLYYIRTPMSVYRKHDDGRMGPIRKNPKTHIQQFETMLFYYESLLSTSPRELHNALKRGIAHLNIMIAKRYCMLHNYSEMFHYAKRALIARPNISNFVRIVGVMLFNFFRSLSRSS